MDHLENRSRWTPVHARQNFRHNNLPGISTGDIAMGHVQASVVVLPSSVADDFAEFCKLNQASCAVIYQSKPGEVGAPPLAADSDIRTDLSMYSVIENETYSKVVPDVLDIPFDNLVSFYLGCSYSFEHALSKYGLPLRHIAAGCDVPGYITTISSYPVGPFAAKLVVTMRPFPRNLVQKAVEATVDLHLVHGAPVHIGHPCWIGINDFSNPDFDDPPVVEDGDVCLFWACGTTAALALRDANLSFAIGLGPETNRCVFITDHRVEDFFKMHPPKHGLLRPRVLFISEKPVFASLISDKALEQIQELEMKYFIQKNSPNAEYGLKEKTANALAKAAMTLSHAFSVAIVTADESASKDSLSVLSIIKAVAAKKEKEVTLLVPEGRVEEWQGIISRCVEKGKLREAVRIVQLASPIFFSKDDDVDTVKRVSKALISLDGFKDEGMVPHKLEAVVGPGKQGTFWVKSKMEVMEECHVTSTTHFCWNGQTIAMATYLLNCCPIHSRYVRRGIGLYTVLDLDDYIFSHEDKNSQTVTSQETKRVLLHEVCQETKQNETNKI